MPYPSGPGSEFPNEYGDSNVTSTGLSAIAFGFPAAMVRILANGVGPAYVRLRSTGTATTGDFQISSGEALEVRDIGVRMSGFAWASTSTGAVLRVGAWG